MWRQKRVQKGVSFQSAFSQHKILEHTTTGYKFSASYSLFLTSDPRTLGIRNIRRLNMSRGAREGNNAFTKDQSVSLVEDPENSYLEKDIMQWNLPISFVKKVCLMSEKKETNKITDTQSLIGNIFEAVRWV